LTIAVSQLWFSAVRLSFGDRGLPIMEHLQRRFAKSIYQQSPRLDEYGSLLGQYAPFDKMVMRAADEPGNS
jgi:hypothetical protein